MDPAELVLLQKRHAFEMAADPDLRRILLHRLIDGTEKHESRLLEALATDLGKHPVEAFLSEIQSVRSECSNAIRHVAAWMKPKRRRPPLIAWPSKAVLHRDPCGSVLIIGPWNYPVHLTLTPLAGALAAGNAAVIKPSERAPRVAHAIRTLVEDTFSAEEVAVIEGDGRLSRSLVDLPFDHIFFTGSRATGTSVMRAASQHPTPVTLELGGKCPVLVFGGRPAPREKLIRDLPVIARRIAWGKFLNAGQTCVAPDHVLVEEELHAPLLEALARAFDEFGTADLGKMVDLAHFERVRAFLEEGTIYHGGRSDAATLRIHPTILSSVRPDSSVTREEIFGPVLPVVRSTTPEEAIATLQGEPLAAYVFTHDDELFHRVSSSIRTGALCRNEVLLHVTGVHLPFGGVGTSGIGRYRGKSSFDTFTRERVVLARSLSFDPSFRYPPFRHTLDRIKAIPSWLTGG